MRLGRGKRGVRSGTGGFGWAMFAGAVFVALLASWGPGPSRLGTEGRTAWGQSHGGNWRLPPEPPLLDESSLKAAIERRLEGLQARRLEMLERRRQESLAALEQGVRNRQSAPPLPRTPPPLPSSVLDEIESTIGRDGRLELEKALSERHL